MPRSLEWRAPGWLGLLGVLATSLGAMGCPGTLDPSLLASGSGGSSGTGGAGGGGVNCSGALDGASLVTGNCAIAGCHNTSGAPLAGAGLDLTVDATIGSRLVGVNSTGDSNASSDCPAGFGPYLKPNSNPAAGLLIDKITVTAPNDALLCPGGSRMPFASPALSADQQTCIEQWAEGLIMAAQ